MQSNVQAAFQFRSVYLHFPFCEAKCHYCDFYSLAESKIPSNQRSDVYEALGRELERHASVLEAPLDTLFLGGGTPSLVPLEAMAKTLSRLDLSAPSAEITMEANPSSISCDKARVWPTLGINRISMGVQALNDARLQWLGRVHSVKGIHEALDCLFSSGFESVNVDYILGVPDQTPDLIRSELGGLLDRFPAIKHVSAYLLTLKPGNPKYQQLPDEEIQLSHLITASELLAQRGFEHYEISNFAKPGFRSRHNENYWLGGGYLGIGPSAHGFWPHKTKRTKNWAHLEKYVTVMNTQESSWEWTENLTAEQRRIEYLMLRLRRSEGLNFEEYNDAFDRDLRRERAVQIEWGLKAGLCERQENKLSLTERGMFLSDQIISNFI